MIAYTPAKVADSIPLIDLGGSFSPALADRKAVAYEIHKACRETGFFYVSNHGVASELIDSHLQLCHEFFSLPLEEKQQVSIKLSSCNRGYEGFAAQTLNAGAAPDLKEGFLIGNHMGPAHPYVLQGVPNCGPNQWPLNPADFKPRFMAYIDAVSQLGLHLTRLLALSLELPEDYFDEGFEQPGYIGRLLHYPPRPLDMPPNQLGAGAHTDWGMLTILLQDEVGGLEVANAKGEWLTAPPIKNTFVINTGELIKVMTNGLYHANLHRVINNDSGRSRYSSPLFFDPDYFYKVSCVPGCRPEGTTESFPTITLGEHIAHMYRLTFG